MRCLFGILVVLIAQPATACEFVSKDGYVIEFLQQANIPPGVVADDTGAYPFPYSYAVIDGRKCDFTLETFTCDGKTSKVQNLGTSFIWKGKEYVTTDSCSAGPE